MEIEDLKKEAEGYEEQLVRVRRQLHHHPELSFKEESTSAMIRSRLAELNIPIMEGVRGYSTVGVLKGSKPGPVLLFRADIDALPINEQSGVSFSSECPGVMHACGHDAHTSTLLAFADWISKHRDLICGTVKLVFQSGEDQLPGGGKFIVEDGVLDDVDYAFAWHCEPNLNVGELSVTGGPRSAAVECFRITIQGVGGHGGFPSRAIDPISTGAEITTAISQLINWTVDPFDTATITVSRFDAGLKGIYNIIPSTAVLEGHLRSLSNDTADLLLERLERLAKGICQARGCQCTFEVERGYPAMANDKKAADFLRQALQRGGMDAKETAPLMIAEDFAYYTMKVPGVYINNGTRDPARPETACSLHNPHFTIDEHAMVNALEAMMRIYVAMTTEFPWD